MQQVTRVAALLAFLTMAAPGAALALDSNKLHDYCTAPKGTPDYSFCMGYIAGTVERIYQDRDALIDQQKGAPKEAYCDPDLPADIHLVEIKNDLLRFYQLKPEMRFEVSALSIQYAFALTYGCRGNDE